MWWMWLSVGLALDCDPEDPALWDCVYRAGREGDDEALPFAEALVATQPTPQGWLTLGNLLDLTGDPAAMEALQKAASGFEAEGASQRQLFAEMNLATAQRQHGDPAAGRATLDAALERTADDPKLNAIARLESARFASQVGGDLGATYRDLLDLESALTQMPPHGTRLWWHTRATLESMLDRPQHAAGSFMELARFSEELGDAYGAAGARSNALEVLQEDGAVEDAWWEMWRTALDAAAGDALLPHRAKLWCTAAAQANPPEGALAACTTAAEQMPPSAGVALDARTLVAEQSCDHPALAAIAADAAMNSNDAQLRVLEVSAGCPGDGQVAATTALLDHIERSSARISDPLLSARFTRRWAPAYLIAANQQTDPAAARAIHERLHHWRVEQRRAQHREPAENAPLLAVVAKLERARQDGDSTAMAELAAEEGRLLAALATPWVADAAELAALRVPGEALVSFVLNNSGGQAWVLDDQGERIVALPGLPAAQAASIASLLASQPALAEEALDTLAASLWAPLGLQPGADVVVIADGGLLSLGPAALAERGPALESLSEAPSLAAWAWWRTHTEPSGEASLLVGDIPPPIAGEAERRSTLAALPAASRELAHIATRRTVPVLLREDAATEAAVEGALGTAGLLHFATHAVAESGDPGTSAVFLAADGTRDGRWTAREIATTQLPGAVVILSACSGAGGEPSGAGVIGLSQAFLEAGARAVVASRWPVRDEASARFSMKLHDELAAGKTIAAAAQAARAVVPEDTAAAFTVLGDGRARLPGRSPMRGKLIGLGLIAVIGVAGAGMLLRNRRP